MKRCPECRRDYLDDSLLYCLEDGAALVQGSVPSAAEQQTAILSDAGFNEARTKIPGPHPADTSKPSGVNSWLFRRRTFFWLIAAAGLFLALVLPFAWRYSNSRAKSIGSIAVMPFVNESGNSDLEFLSDGITDTLISSLSRIPTLTVKAHTSVFRYKGKSVSPQTVAHELSAESILNGRVVQHGGQLSVLVELIDPQSENVIWSEKYDRKEGDLLAMQTEIAKDVSTQLRSRLSGEDSARVTRSYTTDPNAYQAYLRGRYHFYRRLPNDIAKAAEFFQQAIQIDPNYALAYSGLADAYALSEPPKDSMPKAREAALRALSLDSDLADAHNSLGLIAAVYDHDFSGSEREFKRAAELDPNNATTHFYLGNMYAHLCRFDEALDEMRRAVELEPYSLIINRTYGDKLAAAGRYEEGIAQLNRTVDLDQNYPSVHASLSGVYELMGDQQRSVEEFARYVDAQGRPQVAAALRDAFKAGGRNAYLRKVIEMRPVSNLAPYYAALGENDNAFRELDRLIDERDYYVVLIKEDRRLEPLHNDPRFNDLLRRAGLPL